MWNLKNLSKQKKKKQNQANRYRKQISGCKIWECKKMGDWCYSFKTENI